MPRKVWGEYPKKRALKFSKHLHDCGIDLVLCTEEIDDRGKRFHSSWHIGRTVCRAKHANFICHVAAVQPIHSLTADVCHDMQVCSFTEATSKAMKIGRVKSFRQIVLGNKYHVVLEEFVHSKRSNKVVAAQLLLRSF